MGLQTYNQKRNFTRTREPHSGKATSKGDLKFVVQRHAASHLHYDFRLELEGVLKSWAVPKGPSLNPGDKRLAMMVEDHPYDYRTFEGVIPAGNYGAGIVEIWDEGTFHAIGIEDRIHSEKELLKELKNGSLKFVLNGKKLKGEFALVKINKDEKNTWLLIKHKDKYATTKPYSSEEHVAKNSPINKSRKQKEKALAKPAVAKPKKKEAAEGIDLKKIKGVKKSPMPHAIKPMLAKLKDQPFDGKEWLFEIKWDGYRAISEINNGKVELYSRNGLSFKTKYPIIIEALKEINHKVVLDGEIVVLDKNGKPQFQEIQQYETDNPNICYYVFDILHLDGYDLTGLPLIERKKILKSIISEETNIRFSDHIEIEGNLLFKEVRKKGLEGIVAKEAQSTYRKGARSGEWLKIKSTYSQEAVIVGYTEPRGSRKDFGALILGVYEKGGLRYVGHSGGGFSESLLKELKQKLDKIQSDKSPFKTKIKTNMPVTWVTPKYVCEVEFTEWTSEGLMRHPVFKGLRIDKEAKEVIAEKEDKSVKEEIKKVASKEKETPKGATKVVINHHSLMLSNLDKVYWPDEKFTKGDVINYYQSVAKYILPYLKDRPQSLNRHPHGITDKGFYQKNMGDITPAWIKTVDVPSEDRIIKYMLCQNEASLAYMNNLGCIEINPWNSRAAKREFPDYMVIDLDPSTSNFEEVIEAALAVKEVLEKAGATGYCKTSGASGMHIYVPTGAKYNYDHVKEFGNIIAILVNQMLPDTTTVERVVKARGKKIYLDYLQNRIGQTLASVYSLRPYPGATISTPLEWKEVKKDLHPSQFNIQTIQKRLEKKGDLFSPVLGKGIDIKKCIKNLGG